jgi:hypothetical protein
VRYQDIRGAYTRHAPYDSAIKELRSLDKGWRKAAIGPPNKCFAQERVARGEFWGGALHVLLLRIPSSIALPALQIVLMCLPGEAYDAYGVAY